MYNNQLVQKVVIWVVFLISLWTEKVALRVLYCTSRSVHCYFILQICTFSGLSESFTFIDLSYYFSIFNKIKYFTLT